MSDIFEYLKWRADVPFSADPFNEVDSLILSELAYTNFDGIVPSDASPVPLSFMRDQYFQTHTREKLHKDLSFMLKAPLLMDEMLSGARFSGLSACCYINEIDENKRFQLSAITFLLSDKTLYVAFRGTDNSLTGWREDFDFSYLSETYGQQQAVSYLENVASRFSDPIRVGGHSKGGNFAVYASAFCKRQVQDRIISIYSNDGPGFRDDVINDEGYHRILPKVFSIVPENSIIGLLLSNLAKHNVVRSIGSGIMQHDGFTWSVNRNVFERAELTESAKFINRAIDSWIDKVDDETRKSFTQSVFSIIEATGKDSFQDIAKEKLKSLEAMVSSMQNMPKEKQSELLRLAGELLQSGGKVMLDQLPDALSFKKQQNDDPSSPEQK